jgi:glycosyltransferase involved in cell wall biosynthesis
MSGSLYMAYDARFSLGHYRGMGRFLRYLIAGRERDILGFCATGEGDASLNLVASGLKSYPLWEQVSIPKLVRRHKIRTFLAPYNTAPLFLPKSVKLVIVVHDLIFMDRAPLSRSLHQNFGRIYRRLVVPRAVRRADLVVTCSHFSEKQLISRFDLDRNKIRVTLFQAEASALGVSNFVDFLHYIPDSAMRRLFQEGTLFVMPSISEGFGIPVLEAMASGLPVAASSSTCLQEVGGEAARYFDPLSIEDMAATMSEILGDSALQAKMSEQGRMQSRKFHSNVVREQIRSFWTELGEAAEPVSGKDKHSW